MKRKVYAFDSMSSARRAIDTLQEVGVNEREISLIARSDIQLDEIPSRYLDASTDFMPALTRGAAVGGVTGMCVGLIAMAVPTLGVTLAGPILIACFAGGSLLGAWSSALVGASIPDVIRRKFEDEIHAGRILLVVDATSAEDQRIVTHTMAAVDRHLIWQSETAVPGK